MSDADVFEKKIKKVDEQLKIIDSQISKLQITKKKLLHAKEELKDKKYFVKSTELAQNDWAQGNKKHGFSNLIVICLFLNFRNISMVKKCTRKTSEFVWCNFIST